MPRTTLLTPQARIIYTLLQQNSSLTAVEIAEASGIIPNAVYRAIKQLLELGVTRKTRDYPVRFVAVPPQEALSWYMLGARRQFLASFLTAQQSSAQPVGPTISIIKSREALLRQTDNDTRHAGKSIDFIVSGLEVPGSTILAYRWARSHNIPIRALVQKRGETSQAKMEKWQRLGVDVRYTTDLGIRLFVFDNHIAYFTSYSQAAKDQAFGVRFDYPPMAAMLGELFEDYWSRAKIF